MEQTCKNCKFFCQHYIINHYANIRETDYGHCRRKRITGKAKSPSERACNFWQSDEEIKKELNAHINARMKTITKQLYEITKIKEEG